MLFTGDILEIMFTISNINSGFYFSNRYVDTCRNRMRLSSQYKSSKREELVCITSKITILNIPNFVIEIPRKLSSLLWQWLLCTTMYIFVLREICHSVLRNYFVFYLPKLLRILPLSPVISHDRRCMSTLST